MSAWPGSSRRRGAFAPLTVARAGVAAVLVEQDLHLAFRLADEVAVMRKGRIVHRSPTADRARADALLGAG
ncbi:hypothetical protein GCM10009850_079520 [Nonomuraea monospora]|uniref:ABC transporter ATP-binding protein n=1 Tax=Nonomuraea monospora TaxID=568818 RepID=A0ABP5PL95_9ACTN